MKPYLFAAVLISLTACGGSDSSSETPALDPTPKPTPELAINVCYLVDTTMGEFTLGIDNTNMPVTSANFSRYVNEKFYDGTLFHRIANNFVNQGGGFTSGLNAKSTNDPIKNESSVGLKNNRGTIAMARTQVLDSATSQFFINIHDNDNLNYPSQGGYAVFGMVVEGMEVVDIMNAVNTQSVQKNGQIFTDVPVEEIVINSIRETNCPG
ncbi:peptidylprolyl isomerase [Shewanella sp. OMA3-2]|uniref:peptidylprolyl isomerase n=1 Tax=Shewanella sp. OMA3-2 TaxID=2908650 RepID=UPI001F3499D6|nr:peptidylprolyl isomerase [Shewanella sp. OMA3-2]UJF21274.1 peptidylprolyl isomerase [Shewanella sp. OMA3-2]